VLCLEVRSDVAESLHEPGYPEADSERVLIVGLPGGAVRESGAVAEGDALSPAGTRDGSGVVGVNCQKRHINWLGIGFLA